MEPLVKHWISNFTTPSSVTGSTVRENVKITSFSENKCVFCTHHSSQKTGNAEAGTFNPLVLSYFRCVYSPTNLNEIDKIPSQPVTTSWWRSTDPLLYIRFVQAEKQLKHAGQKLLNTGTKESKSLYTGIWRDH
ncbi:hypothetical protein CHARACLAT_019252 [Characodon lateralis]|uniref:Uncharacterized protein n=1 Tax=Characodon lateralis TaxID=208331 RepID=A0ABU7DSE0_9TELE|nr:hypothetical protein [Characodon lateralis]